MMSETLSVPDPMVLTRNKRDEFLVEIRKSKNSSMIKQKRIKICDGLENSQQNDLSEDIEVSGNIQNGDQTEPQISVEVNVTISSKA